jgi:hypothetical protein
MADRMAAGRTEVALATLDHDCAPAGESFDRSLGISTGDLEALCKESLAGGPPAGRGAP